MKTRTDILYCYWLMHKTLNEAYHLRDRLFEKKNKHVADKWWVSILELLETTDEALKKGLPIYSGGCICCDKEYAVEAADNRIALYCDTCDHEVLLWQKENGDFGDAPTE